MSENPRDNERDNQPHNEARINAATNEPAPDAPSDAAAYALDALDPAQARTVADQASTDPALANELASYQETAAILGQAVPPVQPSTGLRSSLLSQIASLPQQGAAPGAAQGGAEAAGAAGANAAGANATGDGGNATGAGTGTGTGTGTAYATATAGDTDAAATGAADAGTAASASASAGAADTDAATATGAADAATSGAATTDTNTNTNTNDAAAAGAVPARTAHAGTAQSRAATDRDSSTSPDAGANNTPALANPQAPAGRVDTDNRTPAVSSDVAHNVTHIGHTRSGRLRNSILAAAAAIALFLGGMGVNQLMVSNSQATQQAQALSTLLEADDLQGATAPLADGSGSATVMWSPTHGRAAVAAADFGALPEGKVYELWFIGSDGAIPAGTFTANDGVKMVLLDGEMSAGDAVGITIEPEGGSKQPTTDPIVLIQS